jgi:hypothetical protein
MRQRQVQSAFRLSPGPPVSLFLPAKKRGAVVHFWLCAKCAKTYTLQYREKSGAAVLRLKHPPAKGSKATVRKELRQTAAAGAR